MERLPILLLLSSCATAPPRVPSSQPAGVAELGPARAIARDVMVTAGIDQLAEVAQIDFRFVVIDGEDRIFAADHQWDLRNDRAHIRWVDPKTKEPFDVLLFIRERTAEGTIGGKRAATEEERRLLAEKAYARYINDTFWLMVPLKLMDPGTKLELLPQETIDGEPHHVLRLSFDGVGLTPGDVYTLYVNPTSSRIVRWTMALEGKKDEPRSVAFTDYRPVGPLLLAHDHVTEGTARRVVFEETRAFTAVDRTAFAPR